MPFIDSKSDSFFSCFRSVTRPDFRRAYRIVRLRDHHKLNGYDPEDGVIADPRTGEPKRLVITLPRPSHQAQYVARVMIGGHKDQLAARKPGAVLLAQLDRKAGAPDLFELFGFRRNAMDDLRSAGY